jgi:hypothetical protein
MVSDVLDERGAGMAFAESWSVMPHLIHAVGEQVDKHAWNVYSNQEWQIDGTLYFQCHTSMAGDTETEDHTVYLDITGWSWDLSGFYVQTGDDDPLFAHVALPGGEKSFLYKHDGLWIIGESPYQAEGLAYLHDDAAIPSQIVSTDWHFARNHEWLPFESFVLSGTSDINVYAAMWEHRRIRFLPEKQGYFELRNNLIMPSVGFGTGGIHPNDAHVMIADALRAGYRMLDLAREYKNEEIVADVLDTRANDPDVPLRHEVFVVSKVWPTHLGFETTTKEIINSLRAMQTPYVDMYMLHWPM